jgi:hypothetical protein
MRYLKEYNSTDLGLAGKQELQEFCKTYLAYLLDDDWNIYVSYFKGDGFYQIMIKTPPESDLYSQNRNWSEIKDTFFPFYHMLLRDYELVVEYDEAAIGYMTKALGRNGSHLVQSRDSFEFDTLKDSDLFCMIYIRVKKKEEPKEKRSWFNKLINR